MDITKIDKNFAIQTNVQRDGLTFHDAREYPFKTYGIIHEDGMYRRIPKAIAVQVSKGVSSLHANTAGGRVKFVTNSPYIAISAKMNGLGKMPHFAFTGSIGFDLFAGNRYMGTFKPPYNITNGFDGIIDLPDSEEQEYTINFPLYSNVITLHIGIEKGSTLKPAAEYDIKTPIVYYGSSITQGGCASRPGNTYQSIISRELNCDHINLGFSGNARAEDTIADYIAGLDMTAFVYDYDHNAPNVQHLRETHEKMFKTIRKACPTLPILILSRPQYYLTPEEKERLSVIKQTHQNALNAGDKNVYLIEGPDLLIDLVRESALVDNCHPNDSGFVSMAYVIGNKLKQILK